MFFRFLTLFVLTFSCSTFGQTKHIELDGSLVEYRDVGKGKYTFVFESGIGMGASYWDSFLPLASELNSRVIIYSRAGNGLTEKADNITLALSFERLDKLLQSLNVTKNIILVGHSFGGFHARQFAYESPQKVVGIVLLDPSHELFQHKLEELTNKKAVADNLIINGMLKTQPEWQVLQAIYAQKSLFEPQPTYTVPTVIVTSSRLNESDWWIGHSAKGKEIWRSLHQQLISKNPRAVHIITNQVGHNLPIQDPDLTLRAIKTIFALIENV
ncbi:alpha/beta fold hydrolase [Alteromonas sp. ASW11-130]|uniref:alpha/beta fold hydrolase n=1 Tax=Alteromonas sp. ASW11-130 TaxID=3015775 RepID=UPI0022423880|nr:alpha/beta hydrolase [Alteromonas sp. ASW11-130]MCW8093085.1 alpha/beta hydrolase [Alteromonas sp. ASW11-130]